MAIDTADYSSQRFFPASVEDKLMGAIGRATGFVLLGVIVFGWLSLATWTTRDPSLTLATSGPVQNMAGAPGAIVADLLLQMIGLGSVMALFAPMFWSVQLINTRHVSGFRAKLSYYPLSVLAMAGAFSALPASTGWPLEHGYGGILGDFVFGLVAEFFAILNPARAGAATGILLGAIGVSVAMRSLGLFVRDLQRILFQPLRSVNWREKTESWQNVLLSEARRLRDNVRDSLDTEWSDDKTISSKEADVASALSSRHDDEHRAVRDTVDDATEAVRAAESMPNIIVNGETERPATKPGDDRGVVTTTMRAPAPRSTMAPTYESAPPYPDTKTSVPNMVRAASGPHPMAASRSTAGQATAWHPQTQQPAVSQASTFQGTHGAPAKAVVQTALGGALADALRAPARPAVPPQPQSEFVLSPTTPHPVSNPFEHRQSGAPAAQSIVADPKSTASEFVPVRQTIAEKFAAHATRQAVPDVDKTDDVPSLIDGDDDDFASRAIAKRFAPSTAQDVEPTQHDLPAPARLTAAPPPPQAGGPVPALMQAKSQGTARARFMLPSTKLLAQAKAHQTTREHDPEYLRQRAEELQTVLADFGVKGAIKNIRPGPVVTLYEFEPARGIKSSRVIALADDLARSMSALSARVAVVPGRNAIGIELPNAERRPVVLRELLDSNTYRSSGAALPMALGKSIGGEAVVADLARMPHLLVAGTTGSGKSVGVNAMVLSILFKHSPDACRLLMIDPKMLELSVYNDIPHLLAPVITDPQKAVSALNWAVCEMEERYKRMSELSVRNIGVYNNRIRHAKTRGERLSRTVHTGFDAAGQAIYENKDLEREELPHIVVVVDEFADLMLVAGKEIEAAIQRLAQMARAAGIHLIMATQRPSVDVITGTIKANFPTRISFKVTSKVDSRTILNEQGAEQLLGQGDMLYASGSGQTVRVHGPFVSDEEVEAIADHLRSQATPAYVADVTAAPEPEADTRDDKASAGEELYDQAVAIVLRDQKASTSYIQRRLSIGYNRAADLIERMEQDGVIGPAGSGGKRDILVSQRLPTGADSAA